MEAVRRSGKRGVGIVPGIAVFGMSKDGAPPCDQDTDVEGTGWRQGAFLLRDPGGIAVQSRAGHAPSE